MCLSEQKFEIYEEMLNIEDRLYKLTEYTNLQDRGIYPAISTFSRRWTDILNKYHSLNRSSFLSNLSKNGEKRGKSE